MTKEQYQRYKDIRKYIVEEYNYIKEDEAERLKQETIELFKTYNPIFSSDFYLEFINSNGSCFSFEENRTFFCNTPSIYTMFTIATQHVRGNTVEHCIDLGMKQILENKKIENYMLDEKSESFFNKFLH